MHVIYNYCTTYVNDQTGCKLVFTYIQMYIEINKDHMGTYVGLDSNLFEKRLKATAKKPKAYGILGNKIPTAYDHKGITKSA
jgi:hypothetical protein